MNTVRRGFVRYLSSSSSSGGGTIEADLCVLGCGPAGYSAAIRARDYGKKVIVVEKDKIGGAGVRYVSVGLLSPPILNLCLVLTFLILTLALGFPRLLFETSTI